MEHDRGVLTVHPKFRTGVFKLFPWRTIHADISFYIAAPWSKTGSRPRQEIPDFRPGRPSVSMRNRGQILPSPA